MVAWASQDLVTTDSVSRDVYIHSGTRVVTWSQTLKLFAVCDQALETVVTCGDYYMTRTYASECFDASIEMVIMADNALGYLNAVGVLSDQPTRAYLKTGLKTFEGIAVCFSALRYEFLKYSFTVDFIDDDYEVTDNGSSSQRGGQLKIWFQSEVNQSDPEAGEAGYDYSWDSFSILDVASILSYFALDAEDYAYNFNFSLRVES